MRVVPWVGVGAAEFDWYRWENLGFEASAINPTGAPNPPDIDGDNAGCYLFAPTADNVVGIIGEVPHAWLEQSEIRPHIRWTPTDATVGNVYWRLSYKLIPYGSVIPAAWTVLNKLQATPGVADQHVVTSFDPISMSGILLDTIILLNLSRPALSEATDTYGADARLFTLKFHYRIRRTGSLAEFGPT